MDPIFKQLSILKLLPVIEIEDSVKAVSLASALCKGGLPCAVITFRSSVTEEVIRSMTTTNPEMLIGASAVFSMEQLEKAYHAGAEFIVSPEFNPKLIAHCQDLGIPIVPSCSCPSDIKRALEYGLEVVNIFPTEYHGSENMLESIDESYRNIKLILTDDVNEKNLSDYLTFNNVLACSGNWIVKDDLIKTSDWTAIEVIAQEAVNIVHGFTLAHVGINSKNTAEAEKAARTICMLFRIQYKPNNKSIFAGNFVEFMKTPFKGEKGHIGIKTNSVSAAMEYLRLNGIEFDESTLKFDATGELELVYLKNDIAGFAFHLVK
jgi:2-dehydro-3-deoxyphosphogluconate aldolase/(4S)-4-hydroxy-2-oxoglutarate aldolase